MGTLWKQSKGSVWGFGAGEGAGNKAEGDRDTLAGLGEKKGASSAPCAGSSSTDKNPT